MQKYNDPFKIARVASHLPVDSFQSPTVLPIRVVVVGLRTDVVNGCLDFVKGAGQGPTNSSVELAV